MSDLSPDSVASFWLQRAYDVEAAMPPQSLGRFFVVCDWLSL